MSLLTQQEHNHFGKPAGGFLSSMMWAVQEEAVRDMDAPARGEGWMGPFRAGGTPCAPWALSNVPAPRGARCLAAAHPWCPAGWPQPVPKPALSTQLPGQTNPPDLI